MNIPKQITRWLKKIFKCMLIFIAGIIGLIVLLVGITIVNTTWHTDKFRFENFKTADELIEYIKNNYPNGSDSQPLIDLLKKAGADCELIPKTDYDQEDKALDTYFLYECLYNAGWLYWPTSMLYSIHLWIDKNGKLIDFSANRYYGGL